ncbi:MAG: hypothetical protein KKH74_13610 [Gammaproteobacteria bacterium]|nr:hypothetical protein [Gammaproteobacteria bacterium]MBU1732822.1 hypothetical protein [Gammaproteobacteria bacterium]MBU1891647.1 hypothetical protein [Gammaproteobacteria bacterium]
MSFIESYGKEIVALIVPFIAWVLNSIFKAKAKLFVALPHQFTFLVQQPLIDSSGTQISPTQTVKTNSFIIRNAGRESATKLELVFNWQPMCVNLWPVRHYEEHTEPDRRYVLIFDSLAPDEILGVEVLSVNSDLPNLVTVRSAECVAQNINMYPQPVVSNAVRRTEQFLIALGIAAAIYLTIILVQFLVLRTPLGH